MEDKKEKYIYVKFEDAYTRYIYKTNLDCQIGNIVEAPTQYVLKQPAIIVDVVYLSDKQLPIDKEKILEIKKIISKRDKRGVFDKISFLYYNIEWKYLDEWKFHYENNWVKRWKSCFGGSISYEQDGVLETYYDNNFYFSEYTITSEENLDIKIKFVQSIFSKLHHKEITEEEFREMLFKVT